jgi:probable F420-dependent oxidoreductase
MPRLGHDPVRWAAQLRQLEDLGFSGVAVSEHYSQGWAMDALTAMNFALSVTTRLRVGPLVLNNDLHHPGRLAKAIATADVLSHGRAGLGLGAGWLAADYRALGVALDPPPVRLSRLAEALQIIRAYFAGETVTFHGDHYRIEQLEALPAPVQQPRPPILVGGSGHRLLALGGRQADIVGINTRPGPDELDEAAARALSRARLNERVGWVEAAASAAGRPRPELQFSCYDVNVAGVQVTATRPSFGDYVHVHQELIGDSPVSLRGDVAKCADDLRRWKDELGISCWHLGGNLDALAPLVARLSAE